MKTVIKILGFALLFLIALPNVLFSQDTTICHLLGKNTQAVVNKYGKPLHQDKSDPTMECTFYQSKTSRMAFIANKSGVYQIQVDYYYNSKDKADDAISGFLSTCGSKSMQIDTVNTGDYRILGTGVRMSLTLFQNTYSKKYEVKFKADKSEIQ